MSDDTNTTTVDQLTLQDPVKRYPSITPPAEALPGTGLDAEGRVISTGGRVLTVVGTGPELTTARHAAYATIARLELEGSFYRTDIARRAASDQMRAAQQ